MTRFLTVLSVSAFFSLGALLQACASQEEVIEVEKPPVGQYYNLMEGGGAIDMGGIDPLRMVAQSTDPSVEIFPLDGPPPSPLASAAPSRGGASGQSYPGNPDIEIYTLDGGPLVQSGPGNLMPETVGRAAAPPPETPNYVAIDAPDEPLVRIYFEHDAVALSPQDMDEIMAVTSRFNPNRDGALLSVEGFASVESAETDPVKRRTVNMRIAMDRAYSVARALIESGIPAEKIRTVAWGEVQPGEPMDGRSPVAASRRVDVVPMRQK